MTELYKEIKDIVDFELDPEEEEKAHRYCKSLRIISGVLMLLIVLAGAFGIYCIYADIHWGFFAFLAFAILSVVFFNSYKKKYIVRVTKLLNDDCCVSKALTAYIVMLQYSRRIKRCDVILSCIGSSLFYSGKFEECKKVAGLLDKYTDTIVGKAYEYSLLAMVALYEKDKEALECCIEEFETMVSQDLTAYIRLSYNVIARYPEVLEAEENADYVKMTELTKTEEKDCALKKVCANYRQYKAAVVAGMEAEASKHCAYVIEKGGDTFYKKELETVN